MKKIISKHAIEDHKVFTICLVIFLVLFMIGDYKILEIAELDPVYFEVEIWYFVIVGMLVIALSIVIAVDIRELTFEGNTITLYQHHLILPFMPKLRKQYSWDDVVAWDETPVLEQQGENVKDPYSIDFLIKDGDEVRLFRTPGSWILIDKKRIRFAEFKQHIKTYLDTIPRDPDWIEEYSNDTTNLGYGLRYTGIVLLIGSLLAMGAGGVSLAVMGVFFSFGMFPIAENYIKKGENIRKRIAARVALQKK